MEETTDQIARIMPQIEPHLDGYVSASYHTLKDIVDFGYTRSTANIEYKGDYKLMLPGSKMESYIKEAIISEGFSFIEKYPHPVSSSIFGNHTAWSFTKRYCDINLFDIGHLKNIIIGDYEAPQETELELKYVL